MRVTFASPDQKRTGAYVVFAMDGGKLSASAGDLDKATGGGLKRALKNSKFKGRRGQTLTVLGPRGVKASRIVILGIGKPNKLDTLAAQSLGGAIYRILGGSGDKSASVLLDTIKGVKLGGAEFAANLAFGCHLRSYRFDKYRTKEKDDDKPSLKSVAVMLRDVAGARRRFSPLRNIADGVFFTRDLVSEPANVIYPISFVSRLRALTKLGVKLQVLDEKQMKKLGMGALLGVAQGSANAPRLVAMRWNGAPRAKDKRPIAFVGKGVTFDTGGISIKPAGGMEDMKWDMGGAGVVSGVMHALAARKAKVNAVGIVGLVENMPSSTAQRPGDVVKTMSGQTIEVINTDAEGRLVLADAMWWCQKMFKPHTIIDLATLTGAIIISLGYHHAGLFANNDKLAEQLTEAGKDTNEAVWRMPLGDAYDKQVRSQIADMKNVGGRDAGSITAAQILQRFIQKDVAWAHLDIAGVTWSNSDSATVPRGGTGFGVRLLDTLVSKHYEGK
ncbi:MAG: leucyl aminopeptidase [Rhodospirillaceae bacterium]|nr:leucyl aminopeptidase [Rhodospirillaceae bacterium]|tara:strand:+ start:3892 stop:5394 length:1503 start_codon:yes stop_codon:yes gene_type:complete